MTKETYQLLEHFMQSQMEERDSAHNQEHIYRVLAVELDIAEHEPGVEYDVLIAACLLHDIGSWRILGSVMRQRAPKKHMLFYWKRVFRRTMQKG